MALHYVMLVLAGLITACQFVATNFPGTPTASIAHGVAGVAASLLPMLGAYSSQLIKPAGALAAAPAVLPAPVPVPAALAEVKAETAATVAALQAEAKP